MEIESIINMAVGSTAEIGYQEGFGSEDLKLLEVDESLLNEIMHKGVVIRGNLNDEAVLCTSDRTYSIKFVMTSNTVLIMPPSPSQEPNGNGIPSQTLRAMASVNGHLELAEIVPDLETLKSLLNMRPYKEENMNDDNDNGNVHGIDNDNGNDDGKCEGLFTFDDLLDRVQMSETELREGLKTLSAFQIGKVWRIADGALLRSTLDLILLNSVQHDWSIRGLDEAQVIEVLKSDGFSPQIVMHCLDTFGRKVSGFTPGEASLDPGNVGLIPKPVDVLDTGSQSRHVSYITSSSTSTSTSTSSNSSSSSGGSSSVWELDQRLVCLHHAKQLLSSGSKWKLDDFVHAWRENVPSEMDAHLDMLKGEALTEKMGSETWLRHFPVSLLPTNPAERFAALFKERSRWEWQDLEPYVRDIKAPGKSVEALLLKFTRRTQPTADALPIFTAR